MEYPVMIMKTPSEDLLAISYDLFGPDGMTGTWRDLQARCDAIAHSANGDKSRLPYAGTDAHALWISVARANACLRYPVFINWDDANKDEPIVSWSPYWGESRGQRAEDVLDRWKFVVELTCDEMLEEGQLPPIPDFHLLSVQFDVSAGRARFADIAPGKHCRRMTPEERTEALFGGAEAVALDLVAALESQDRVAAAEVPTSQSHLQAGLRPGVEILLCDDSATGGAVPVVRLRAAFTDELLPLWLDANEETKAEAETKLVEHWSLSALEALRSSGTPIASPRVRSSQVWLKADEQDSLEFLQPRAG